MLARADPERVTFTERGTGTGDMVGRTGRVTGRVGPGRVGEVMVAVRGGSEAFNAYPYNDEDIAVGELVVVMEHHEPRTVYVSPARR
jgi:hypothetical protein